MSPLLLVLVVLSSSPVPLGRWSQPLSYEPVFVVDESDALYLGAREIVAPIAPGAASASTRYPSLTSLSVGRGLAGNDRDDAIPGLLEPWSERAPAFRAFPETSIDRESRIGDGLIPVEDLRFQYVAIEPLEATGFLIGEDLSRSLPRAEISQATLRGGLLGALGGGVLGLLAGIDRADPLPGTGAPAGTAETTRAVHIDGHAVAYGVFAGWALGTSLGSHFGNGARGSLAENLVTSWALAVTGLAVSRATGHEEFFLPFATFQFLAASSVEWETARRSTLP